MTSRLPAQCLSCKHWESPLDRDDPDARGANPKQICAAYPLPAGIPDEIWWNRADHRQPHKGDHGTQWEPDLRNGKEMAFPEYVMNTAA